MENSVYSALEARMGSKLLSQRLLKQARKSAHLLHQGEGIFRLERFFPLDSIVSICLAATGLRRRGRQNFLDVRITNQEWTLPRLPAVFDGFRLLQLTDLHLDLDTGLVPAVIRLVRGIDHDAAVVTGDFRNKTAGDFQPCLREAARIIQPLAPLRWGILGNHDVVEMVPSLEAVGLPILLNEVAAIERNGQKLWIAGIDDPHFYKTHSLDKVRSEVPDHDCAILLSHTPETYTEAEPLGFDLQLSGHTHGGQICLPGGIPLVLPCKIDRRFARGPWRHGRLQGYTSTGTGGCGVPARFNCPPEIVLHVLRSA